MIRRCPRARRRRAALASHAADRRAEHVVRARVQGVCAEELKINHHGEPPLSPRAGWQPQAGFFSTLLCGARRAVSLPRRNETTAAGFLTSCGLPPGYGGGGRDRRRQHAQ